MGFDAALTKPIARETLLETITTVLGQHTRRTAPRDGAIGTPVAGAIARRGTEMQRRERPDCDERRQTKVSAHVRLHCDGPRALPGGTSCIREVTKLYPKLV
jgi:hypothetical protein